MTPHDTSTRVLFLPEVRDPDTLADLVARASFALHPLAPERVTFVVAGDATHGPGPTPAYFDPRVDDLRAHLEPALQYTDAPTDADVVLQWRHTGDAPDGAYLVDRHLDRMEGSAWVQALFDHLPDRDALEATSRERFDRLAGATDHRADRAYLLGTGPSIGDYADHDFSDGIVIACNTVVLDEDLMEHTRPAVVTFADPIFHFGPSRYAFTFRDAVLAAARRWDFHVVVPLKYQALLTSLVPELEPRVIGIPLGSNAVNCDLRSAFRVKTADNILTMMMVPLAATLARRVGLIGFDGRSPGERYFWRHSPRTQLVDLLDNVRETHPGFFEVDYGDYYDTHCRMLERWLGAGEQAGASFESLTPSYVPALRRRHRTTTPPDPTPALTARPTFRVVSVNPDLDSDLGHYLHHDRAVRADLATRHADLVTLGGRAYDGPEPWVLPTFTHNSWAVNRPRIDLYLETFGAQLRAALERLRAADPDTPTVCMMYAGSALHLLPLLEVAAELDDGRTTFLCNLMHSHSDFLDAGDPDSDVGDFPAEAALLLRATRPLRERLPVRAHVDTPQLQELVARHTGETLPLWPMIGVTETAAAPAEGHRAPHHPLRVFAPSTMQFAKGYDLLAELAPALAGDDAVHLVARAVEEPRTDPRHLAAAAVLREHAEVLEGVLEDDGYARAVADADVILIPYRRRPFWSRTSGVLSDAIMAGKPVVATRQTWTGSIVEEHGLGAVFDDGDVDDLRLALAEVAKRYDDHRARVVAFQETWQASHGPHAVADLLEAVVDEPRQATPSTTTGATDATPLDVLDDLFAGLHAAYGTVRRLHSELRATGTRLAETRQRAQRARHRVERQNATIERTRHNLATARTRAGKARQRAIRAEAELTRIKARRTYRVEAKLRALAARLRRRA